MGILFHDAKMLLDAKVKGASFEQTLTVGHLSLYLHDKEVKKLSEFYAIAFPNIGKTLTTDYRFGDYSDFLFREFLRASALSIIDYSSYEGADIVHDLNQPVPDSLHDNFDAVVDGGSLEHIFNFPIAISNLMNMVKTGGSLFISTPANNLCGHGFYQFSPELMFRVFTEENGFELKRIMLVEAKFPSVELAAQPLAYDVVDPAVVFERVGLMSRHPVTMMIHAKKTRELSLFTNPPLQSDYVTLWKGSHVEKRGSSILRTVLKKISRTVPKAVQTRVNGYRQIKHFSFANRKFYRRRSLRATAILNKARHSKNRLR